MSTGIVQRIDETAPASRKPRQVYRVVIKATPERVWAGITNGDLTSRYFFGTEVRSELQPGSSFDYWLGGEVMVEGRVIEADPPKRLVHTWHALYNADVAACGFSIVTWEIEEQEPGVSRVTLTHEFESEDATYRSVDGGWIGVLEGLKSVAETGAGIPAEPS
jgi:uncharacterized protein YndB with AHSA1/START domain